MNEPRPGPPVDRLLDFSGRTVLVTGVSGGIGHWIVRRFREAGATVVSHVHRDRSLVDELGGPVVVGDVSTDDGAATVLAQVASVGALSVVINNAGVQPVKSWQEMTGAEFDDVVRINTGSVFRMTKLAAESMGSGGSIVNIASIEGLQPAFGHSHYSASKAAIIMNTRAAALELGPRGVRVNAVAPGLIWREGLDEAWPDGVRRYEAASPLGMLGHGDDVADACLFLASPAARWITGTVLTVDGGVLTHPTW